MLARIMKIGLLSPAVILAFLAAECRGAVIFEENFDGYTANFQLNSCNSACPSGGKYSSAKGCYGSPATPGAISDAYDRNPGANKRAFFVPIFSTLSDEGNCGTSVVGSEVGLGSIWSSRSQVIYIRWYQNDTWTGWGNFAKLFRISNGNIGSLGSQRVIPEWKPDGGHVRMNVSIGTGAGSAGDWVSNFYSNYNLDDPAHYAPGTWVCYEVMVDAVRKIVEFWVNGTSKGQKDVSASLADGVYFNSFQISGNYAYKDGQTGHRILFDDIVVADTYVGPIPSQPDTAPPAAPTGLAVR